MINSFYNNTFKRLVNLLLAVVFLSSFSTGASARALCLDEEENHLVDQNFYLADCHSSVDADPPLFIEHSSVRTEKENNDCFDVSFSNAHTLNRPSKIALSGFAKTILSYTLPGSHIESQQHLAGYSSPALFQHLFSLPHTLLHRTVVLLI